MVHQLGSGMWGPHSSPSAKVALPDVWAQGPRMPTDVASATFCTMSYFARYKCITNSYPCLGTNVWNVQPEP